MTLLRLDLTAETDLIFSATAGTAGQHECLDYIPGSAIWGAVAARFYGKWASGGDWAKVRSLFHSGKVRFGTGAPASTGGVPLRPVPIAWYSRKGTKWSKDAEQDGASNRIVPSEIHNLSCAEWNFEANGQPEQIRSGWFDAEGALVTIKHRHRLKTAMDPEKFDSPSESQLFGYSSIPAGTRFVAFVEADPSTLGWNEVKEYLCGAKALRLGRSRSAEFGEVTLKVTEATSDGWKASDASFDARQVVLHLLTDLALSDASGLPQLQPTPELLGLGEGKIDFSRSHLRFRAYSPWNRFRGCHDTERHVISAGSVIALQLEQPPQVTRLVAGLYQVEGLGQMAVNPDYLAATGISLQAPSSSTASQQKKSLPAPAGDPVYVAMHCRYADAVLEQLAVALGKAWADTWEHDCKHVSKSQWARLRQIAVLASSKQDLDINIQKLHEGNLSAEKYWNKPARTGGRTPFEIVCAFIADTQPISQTLLDEGLGERDAAGRDLVALLTIHATREAAIAISRKKSESAKKKDRP